MIRCAALLTRLAMVSFAVTWTLSAQEPTIAVEYPPQDAVFPPEFPPPLIAWKDAAPGSRLWKLEIGAFSVLTPGAPLQLGPVDPRARAATNALPALTREQAAWHTWRPTAAQWLAIRQAARDATVVISFTGLAGRDAAKPLSRGAVRLRFSPDPVGAPIFYRDVPLMPSETEKGVIKPLAASALPLIAWRLRDTRRTESNLLLTGMHTCANCHSFSADGKTLGMDVDGPANDKGLYALAPIAPKTVIGKERVLAWSDFRGKLGGKLRVGFISQVSPDGRIVVTTINDPGAGESEYQRRKSLKEVSLNYYVANFADYRFLQVFYPTRGILAWYSRETGRLEPLPGADDPDFVQTNAVWSPDGRFLVFARAAAREPYVPGRPVALRANDPNETPLRYDLYRIPFNAGRGGRAEPISGAAGNGFSNSFPKLTPDGRWIVFVRSRNGLLMRPDSELWIVPSQGGTPRRMNCNTPLMNSWHSVSPNGRWMVFSSKARSPYTQMWLTHLDADGNDSPAILIENATASNRAVNLPEFVNVPADGLAQIEVPVADYYRVVDEASDLMKRRRHREAEAAWRRAISLEPDEALPHNNLGYVLAELGRRQEALGEYSRALEISPGYVEAHNNLGEALAALGRREEAMDSFERALRLNPRSASAHSNLGSLLAQAGRFAPAIEHLREALQNGGPQAEIRNNLALALATSGQLPEAISELEQAVRLTAGRDWMMLDLLARLYAGADRWNDAVRAARRSLSAAPDERSKAAIRPRLAQYEREAGRTPPR